MSHQEEPQKEAAAKTLEPVRKSIPAWLVSLVFHITLLLMLALWNLPAGVGSVRVVLEFGKAAEAESVELQQFDLPSSDAETEEEQVVEEADAIVEMDVETLIEAVAIADPVKPVEFAPVEIGEAATAVEFKPMFGGRSGAAKEVLLATGGGSEETVAAVELGLKWLARQQNKNGSWSMKGPYEDGSFQENRTAATAMALLAFQGDGNTHQDGQYSAAVAKGVKFLKGKQSRRDGFFAADEPSHQRSYAHAQATIAICELYGMTGDSNLRISAESAVEYSLYSQGREGGWRYEPKADSDLSVTGWFVMALKSAQSAGIPVSHSALAHISSFLDRVQSDDGAGYSYQYRSAPSPAMTAEGLLCRQYLGWPREQPAMALGLNTLVDEWPMNRESMNVYYWYYATQALHHYGGSTWRKWNDNMKVELPSMQVKRGREAGSWSPQADQYGDASGRLYTTCLSIYCLEVYYRHLPLYKLGAGE